MKSSRSTRHLPTPGHAHTIAAATLALLFGSAASAQTWALLQPGNPGNRLDAAAAFDPATNRTVLFGGAPTSTAAWPVDTWLFDGSAWTLAAPTTSPAGRREHAMVTDLTRGRVVLFGGRDASGPLDDTWEWNGTTWTAATPATRPPARSGHCMAYDIVRGVTVMFGGTSSATVPGTLRDTWQWNGTDWTQVVTANAPAAAEDACMCYDFARRVCVLAGGTSFFGAPDQSTWEFDGANWTNVTPVVGPGPTALPGLGVANAEMVYDPSRGVAILFGGRTPNGTYPRDTWEYDGASWRLVTTGGPASRTRFVMVMDTMRAKVVLYGGVDSSFSNFFRDTWEFTPGQRAAYAVFGPGCPGSAGVPSNIATSLPRIGRTLAVTIGNLPAPQVAIFTLGFSNTTSTLGALPLTLAGLGAPGCLGRTSPDGTTLLLGTGGTSTFQLPVPNRTALVGTRFYTEAFVLAPGANALGAVISDAAAATVGY